MKIPGLLLVATVAAMVRTAHGLGSPLRSVLRLHGGGKGVKNGPKGQMKASPRLARSLKDKLKAVNGIEYKMVDAWNGSVVDFFKGLGIGFCLFDVRGELHDL